MKVSVISPVYNSASYIKECIDSLRAQTMQDFEVLFVDDHGQDDSITIAKDYTANDARFRFLATPQNSGPGVARNVGILAARGEYVAFIDSDDVWQPTFLEKLYRKATTEVITPLTQREGQGGGLDLSYCQLMYRGGAKDGQTFRNPVLPEGEFSPSGKQYFLRHFVTFSVCFLFRREFLLANNLLFPARRNSEDTNFLTRCLLLAQSISCVDEPLYVYCIREESLTTGKNRHRWHERLDAMDALMDDFKALKKDPKYASLHLGQYNAAMALIWLKKGLAQAMLELIR